MRTKAIAAAVTVAGALVWSLPATAQIPPLLPLRVTSTPLPLTYVADVLVDHERSQVFVSGGAGNSEVIVLDYNGSIVDTIEGLPSAADMVLLRDRIYALREGGAAVDVVDPSTREVVGTRELPHAGMGEMAFAHGHFWHLSEECGGLASLVGTNASSWRSHSRGGYFYCPTLESTPANPHMILAAESGLSPSQIYRWDVSRQPSTVATTGHSADIGGSDVAIAWDASSFLAAKGVVREVRLPDMKGTGMVYRPDVNDRATAVEWTEAEGGHVAVGTEDDDGPQNLHLFEEGSSAPEGAVALPSGRVIGGSIAFAPEEGRIFAATYEFDDESVAFHVVANGPTAQRTTLSLDASAATIAVGGDVKLEVTLQVPEGATNRRVEVLAIPHGRWMARVASGDVDAEGRFSTTVEPKLNTTYVARWAGDAEYLPEVADAAVGVRSRTFTTLSRERGRTGRWFVYGVNEPVVQTGRVTPPPKSRKLGFEAQISRDGRWRTVLRVTHKMDASGVARTALFAQRPARFRLRNVKRDSWDLLGSASAWRYVLVRK